MCLSKLVCLSMPVEENDNRKYSSLLFKKWYYLKLDKKVYEEKKMYNVSFLFNLAIPNNTLG